MEHHPIFSAAFIATQTIPVAVPKFTTTFPSKFILKSSVLYCNPYEKSLILNLSSHFRISSFFPVLDLHNIVR
ncbi:hypothetical protein CW304_14370 [Bacillus sp. UFRGS-B20]|nr:hypothetical protein CW304_14370 [Bacillus sp. UFRGS-B20]